MKCGVKFCGGCNPGYDRGKALDEIRKSVTETDFINAVEGEEYDRLLVIGGCTSCCAAYSQYDVKGDVFKMWSNEHIEKIKDKLSANEVKGRS